VAAAVCDFLPQRAATGVQHSRRAAEIPRAPNHEHAKAVDFGHIEVVQPAPVAACAFGPLKLQTLPPDSELLFCSFAKTSTPHAMLRAAFRQEKPSFPLPSKKYAIFVLERGLPVFKANHRGPGGRRQSTGSVEARGSLAVEANHFGAFDAARRRARDFDAVTAELLRDVQYALGASQKLVRGFANAELGDAD
jgi:hypothetical protein